VAEAPAPRPAAVVTTLAEPAAGEADIPASMAAAPMTAPASVAAPAPMSNEAAAAAAVLAQGAPLRTATAAAPPALAPPASSARGCPGNPNALGVSRTVEIDTTGGPGFGFEHFRSHDFLREGEVVLTFDDGPWPKHTPAVLAALAAHCTKAIFFPIGKHATYEPGILKQVAAAGHAIGSHTWSHQDLSKKSVQEGKDEIEKGISAVRWAVGAPAAPYFRFPALRHPPELVTYLGERNVGIFSTDFDSFDFKMRKPEQVRQAIMAKLKKHGKGIALMHDFQQATAHAAAELLNDLKAGGYRIVFMKPRSGLSTIAAYDEAVHKDAKLPTVDGRPTSSVVRTISE
jgi:peptidoglycan/xylan/chitin deacetylase (PgdA/CDA1 family)